MEKRTESQRVRDAAGKDGDADFGTMGEGGQFKNMSLDMATLTAKEAELQQFTTIDKIQSTVLRPEGRVRTGKLAGVF